MIRELGEVWREDFVSKKPWRVQGFGAIAAFKTKKDARLVGEFFKRVRDQENEKSKNINP